MARVYFLAAFIALATLASAEPNVDNIDVRVIKDISSFSDLRAAPTTPVERETKYTIGKRVAGDRLVDQSSGSQTFPEHQNVELILNYPKSGAGAIVSFIEVHVKTDSIDGEVVLASGAIGSRRISVVVKATKASFFTYTVAVYGHYK